jgi:hypothetical protein
MRAEATGVRHHDHVLLADQLVVGHPVVPGVPDPGGQPVDGAAAGEDAVDDPPPRGDPLAGRVGERHRRAPGDVQQRVEGDGAGVDDDGVHAARSCRTERLGGPPSYLRRMGDSNSRGVAPNPLSKRAP